MDEPVHLVGLVENKDGRYKIQEEIVNGSNFEFPPIPANVGTIQQACRECGYPQHGCKGSSLGYFEKLNKDEDYEDDLFWHY